MSYEIFLLHLSKSPVSKNIVRHMEHLVSISILLRYIAVTKTLSIELSVVANTSPAGLCPKISGN